MCGDGVIESPEGCDDDNLLNSDGCSSTCTVETGWTCVGAGVGSCHPICGDNLTKGIETCDDGNTVSSDGCSSSC